MGANCTRVVRKDGCARSAVRGGGVESGSARVGKSGDAAVQTSYLSVDECTRSRSRSRINAVDVTANGMGRGVLDARMRRLFEMS